MSERFQFENQKESHNEMREIAGEAYQTTENVFEFLDKQIENLNDPETEQEIRDNLKQWEVGAREAFGIMLQNLQELRSDPNQWKQIQEKSLQNKQVVLEDQQKVALAILTSQLQNPKRASQYFQRAMKDLGVPAGVIFRGQLEEQ